MRTAAFAFLMMMSFLAHPADRQAKVGELMEAQGLLAMMEEQMAAGREQMRVQSKQMLDQMMGGLKPPPEFQGRLRDVSEKFLKAIEPTVTPQDIVAQWSVAYGSQFTDQELDGLLAYYKSPLGRKDVAAAQRAMPALMAYVNQRTQPVIERATRQYAADIEAVVRECCGKK